MSEFQNKTIVASGAASGMGFLCCLEYVKRGGNAVLADIHQEALDAAVKEINAVREGAAIGVVCDVRKYEDVCRVRDEAVRVFGSICLSRLRGERKCVCKGFPEALIFRTCR